MTMTTTLRMALAAGVMAIAVGAAACAGSEGSPTGPSDLGTITPTFSSISSQVFAQRCVGCHGGTLAEAGLNLSGASALAALVNVASTQRGGAIRVIPGNADGSYLVQKLRGDAGIVGVRMPADGRFLTDEQINVIRQWINEGAQNN